MYAGGAPQLLKHLRAKMVHACGPELRAIVLSSTSKGYCVAVQVWAAYSPVKNAPEDAKAKVAAGSPSHSATTGELDIYHANCRHVSAQSLQLRCFSLHQLSARWLCMRSMCICLLGLERCRHRLDEPASSKYLCHS